MTDEPVKPTFGRQPAQGEATPQPAPQPASEYALPTPAQPGAEQEHSFQSDSIDYGDEIVQEPEVEQAYTEPFNESAIPEEVVPPVLRSKKARGGFVRFFNFLMTMAFLGAIGAFGSIWYAKTQFQAKGPLAEATTYVVRKGASFNSIIPSLEEKGIIPKQGIIRVFKRGVSAAGKGTKLKAGEFAFIPGMSMQEVMLQLTEGRSIQYSLGFPEGWTSYKMMQRIAADKTLTGDMPPMPAEGTMLPNTYSFQKGMTRAQFVQLLKDSHQKTVRDIWNSRVDGLPLKTAEEMVILASIVEKETGIAGERPHVASVFINRLRRGMKLQTDPTVIYGIWGGEGKPKGRGGLRRSELDKQTPYNTYQIPALPPGPIANPGIEALKAVANPDITKDLYFVADGTGGHAFSTTLKGHNANVKKWRVIEAQRKKDAAAAEAAKAADGTSGN